MPAFAARTSPIKLTGNILQTEAFRLPDSLPIYGSSELDRIADNRPDAVLPRPARPASPRSPSAAAAPPAS